MDTFFVSRCTYIHVNSGIPVNDVLRDEGTGGFGCIYGA